MGKTAFLFSGMGSQYFHMGSELFRRNPVFQNVMHQLDEQAGDLVGQSLIRYLYDEKRKISDRFDRTLFAYPAIFMVEYALAHVLLEGGIKPDYVMGTSVGEFAAAAVSGMLSTEEALDAVVRQAQLLETHCEAGGMLAVLANVSVYEASPELQAHSELAAVNYPGHFVLSGSVDGMRNAEALLKRESVQPLAVALGFHSSMIDPAAPHVLGMLRQKQYRPAACKLISCLDGQVLEQVPDGYLWDVVRRPVQFQQAMERARQEGIESYLDLGPGGTLAGFAKKNLTASSTAKVRPVMTPFQQDVANLETMRSAMSFFQSAGSARTLTAYVFPGQGSQTIGMGAHLFDAFPEITAQADEILGYSIKELCLNDPARRLGLTQYTQPALYVVNALMYYQKLKETGKAPDYVAGHSLGEYNALLAAGVFDFGTGLRLVKRRGELMSAAVGGAMAAVIGLSGDKVAEVLRDSGMTGIDIANYNTPTQVVIAGRQADIAGAQAVFEAAGVGMYIPLNVSGAFHSRYMAEAKALFQAFLEPFDFRQPAIPIVSNVTARPYTATDLKRNLVEQITSSVKWTESIRYLLAQGDVMFEELGPGNVLTKLILAIREQAGPLDLSRAVMEAARAEVATAVAEAAPGADVEEEWLETPGQRFGNPAFTEEYNLRYAYVAGPMSHAISSPELVVAMGRAGMMGVLGTGGLTVPEVETALGTIVARLPQGRPYAVNLVYTLANPEQEEQLVDLYLRRQVRTVFASAYLTITPALVRYRAEGLARSADGPVSRKNRILAKVSRPEVAAAFLSPAPDRVVEKLLAEQKISPQQAELLKEVPMADDICVEGDGGGSGDQMSLLTLLPVMQRLRDECWIRQGRRQKVRVGAAGGLGTPESVAAAFFLGADFVLTGSINQCTVEASTSEQVKDLLQQVGVQDTEYAPSEELFEMGARVRVLKKGLFFPARATKLYELYRQFDSLEQIDAKTRQQIQDKYLKQRFDAVWEELLSTLPNAEIVRAERNPKYKMGLVFRWYLRHAFQAAIAGREDHKLDYQVYCGPALGAFNQWVKGTALESWRNRRAADIAVQLLDEAVRYMEAFQHNG
jgi:trans-AT polyketide synthase, acyltransferase and oxidoreductase domains